MQRTSPSTISLHNLGRQMSITTGGVIVWGSLLVPLLFMTASCQLSPQPDTQIAPTDTTICESKDIRNSVEMFAELRGCRVVEGFVQIVLIDSADFSEFANISFPELREITDFLLLYRVRGLHSIGKIFPNLSVIRGNTIFLNYALVVYEMLHLQEIGLTSLTDILRGGVYITKNPLLCFVDTIDWNAIARQGHDTHYISTNKALNECPLCPTNNQSCSNSMKTGKPLCWNSHHCQKVCPEKCAGSCSPTGECCDSSCLGGCHGPGSENCFACKDVWYDNRCISTCPDKTYEYLNWRCLQESECYDMPKPHDSSKKLSAYPWKPFKDKCLLHCPPGHLDVETTLRGIKRYQCRLCEGVCKRKCPGANIDSIAAAQKLKGCTSITGALEIQIRGGSNVVKELEENLNMIEEIDHYLKIVRSFPLISLNFLRNLREIHGHSLESSKYALIVLDNQNLLDLWDWEHRGTNFKINNGKLFFHFNPKLCLSKIDKLREISNLANYTDLEVASNSNGDKVACNIKTINARVENTNSKGALILWEAFQHYDSRTLLGYVIYSIEAPYRNVTMYDGRDACGGDGWEAHDVPVPESSDIVKHNLTDLDPYTQYAFYVKTYTIATEKSGAQSPIIYFRTKPDIPSEPMRTTIFSKSSNELVINWSPPLHPNGNVTHYIIVGRWEEYNEDLKEQAKYCNKTAYPSYDPNFVPPKDDKLNSKPEKPQTDSTCSCKQHFADNKAREIEISFEDQLQNRIYVKRMDRKKRDTSSYPKITDDSFNCNDDGQNIDFCRVVYNTTLMVNNLRHFSRYIIDVRACREWEPDENQTEAKNCSAAALISGSTLALDNANDIESQSLVWDVSNKTAGDVLLKWAEPPQPNGLIMAYHIIYKRTDIENYQPITRCITKIEFSKFGNSYTLQKLSPGNYSICVKATSNSGTGKCTDEKYFYIEEVSSAPLLYIAICAFLGMFTILGVLFAMVLKLRRKYSKIPRKRHLIATVNPEYVPTVYEPDDWEVPRSRVELLKEIGQGSFGMVYEGILQNVVDESTEQRCAVKTVNIQAADRDRIEFLNEASVMKAFNTHHVVKLLGVVSRDQPTLVIMELMANGDLKSYLRSHRPDSTENPHAPPPPLKRILRMAAEIADGMAYLSAKKFVHRDLAARNCMVSDDLTVKIGDFGMTRDIYETEYYRKGSKGLLPVRWMAPESLKDGVFTSHSDAWSYGIVLYEMVTLASQPYQGLSNEQVLRYVMDGGLIDRPDNCPDKLYHVMRLCWQQKPNSRPTFLELVSLLHQDVGSDFQDVSFYDSDEGIELRGVLGGEDTPLSITRDIEDFSLSDDDDYKQPRSSNSSKISNGSTTPNGYIIPHQAVKTTKC